MAEDGELVGELERCTRELEALCGGLEGPDSSVNSVEVVGTDTDSLLALEEMAGECAALLAFLELAEDSTDENQPHETASSLEATANSEPSQFEDSSWPEQHGKDLDDQQSESTAVRPNETLPHELDSFADELQALVSHLCDSNAGGDTEGGHSATSAPASGSEAQESTQNAIKAARTHESSSSAATDGSSECQRVAVLSPAANTGPHASRRTSLLVKKLSKRRLRRGLTLSRPQFPPPAKSPVTACKQRGESTGSRLWSRFQSSSVLQHITRQQQARSRVAQAQAAQRRVEAARAKPAKNPSHCRQPSKTRSETRAATPATASSRPLQAKQGGEQAKAQPHVSYLGHFRLGRGLTRSTSDLESPAEPRFLCAVYLHGRRRLGTTFVTFTSLAQFETRVRARFAIDTVASIYRERSDVVQVNDRSRRSRREKLLQRVTSLEQVEDGDTLCVTQDAYEDMTILCEWMKRRQRTLHHFRYEPQSAAAAVTTTSTSTTQVEPTTKQKPVSVRQQPLWDANGRSVGVKTQLPIL